MFPLAGAMRVHQRRQQAATPMSVQRIYGGTNEIMKEIVGRSLGL